MSFLIQGRKAKNSHPCLVCASTDEEDSVTLESGERCFEKVTVFVTTFALGRLERTKYRTPRAVLCCRLPKIEFRSLALLDIDTNPLAGSALSQNSKPNSPLR